MLFASGFGILAVQLLGVKILIPYVGATMPIWGSVISVTLIGGMIGYYAGGTIADRKRDKRIILVLSFLAGICIIIIPALRSAVMEIISGMPYVQGAFLGAILLFLPPTTLLSALVTYLIRFFVRDIGTISQVHGDLYAIATLGSITAVFATSYVLVPHFTLSSILYGTGACVVVLGILSQRMNANTTHA